MDSLATKDSATAEDLLVSVDSLAVMESVAAEDSMDSLATME